MALIIRRADVQGQRVDVQIAGGRIASVGASIPPQTGDEIVEARGGALIPGLHDHHIHLRAWAAARESVFVGPSAVSGEQGLAAVLRDSVPGPDGWVRAVGYHESVAGDLDRHVLDRLLPDVPVRVQHRSGVLWALNSAALRLVGAEDDPSPGIERDAQRRATGHLWRMDRWLAERLAKMPHVDGPAGSRRSWFRSALSAVSEEAASRGITGWTDATPGRGHNETSELLEAAAAGSIRQRLHLMTPLETEPRDGGMTRAGPVKVLLDDSDLPSLDWLSGVVSEAHRQQRTVAVHCVTTAQLALAVAAFEPVAGERGAGFEPDREADRIEHGAIIPPDFVALLAERGLTVVTQPNFVFERGDEYLTDVDPQELPFLWRARSLLDSGVRLAAGSDAPFGSPDPWVAVRASTRRRTRSGRSLGGGEILDWKAAIGLWTGEATTPGCPRWIAPGQPADLVLLREPLPAAIQGDDPVGVLATFIDGRRVFASD